MWRLVFSLLGFVVLVALWPPASAYLTAHGIPAEMWLHEATNALATIWQAFMKALRTLT